MKTEKVQDHTANTRAGNKVQKQSEVQSGVYRSTASSGKTTRQSDSPHLLTSPTGRDLVGREAGGRDGGAHMGQSDGRGRGGGVRLYADGADAEQRDAPVPCLHPLSASTSLILLPRLSPVPPFRPPERIQLKGWHKKIHSKTSHMRAHTFTQGTLQESKGGGIRAWDNGKDGDSRCARGEEGTTKIRSRTERYGGAGSVRRCSGAEAADLVKRRGGGRHTSRMGVWGGGSCPSASDLGRTLRRGSSPHVQRVSGDRPPEIQVFLTSCNCRGSLRWLGMMLAVWTAPASRQISRTASVSDRNGLQGHRIRLFPGSRGQKTWISSKSYP